MFCYSTDDRLTASRRTVGLLFVWNGVGMAFEFSEADDRSITLERFLVSVERNAYRIARYALQDHQRALDAVQDSMLKLVEKYRSRDPEQWPALFYRILRNRLTDLQRRQLLHDRLGKMFSLFASKEIDNAGLQQDLLESGLGAELNPPAQQPERQLLSKELGQKIEDALAGLSEHQCQTFILREWQGLSVRETATALGCSVGSIKQHHYRALQKLRKQLAEHTDE